MKTFNKPLCAVSISVQYSDFLIETAINKNIFDQWIIVTTPDDINTREVCRKYGIQTLLTEEHERDGSFSKGRLVEKGLQMLPSDAWIMHLDADIVLPKSFRHELERAHLQEDTIYGFDRFMVESWEDWQHLKQSGWIDHPNSWHPHGVDVPQDKNGKQYKLGSRWRNENGWVPIGFAQLWNRKGGIEEWRGFRTKPYPFSHGNACRTDVQYSLQWDRRKRELVPELFVAHLGTDGAPHGSNWGGRRTKAFGPPIRFSNMKAPS